jgi:hypothetical protein
MATLSMELLSDGAGLPLFNWCPFAVVNADVGARPLAHHVGQLPQIIAQCGLDLTRLRFRRREGQRADANWKVMPESLSVRSQPPAARAEGEAAHRGGVAGKGQGFPPGRRVPQLRR